MARSHVRLQFGMWRKPGHADVSKDARWLYVTILGDEALNQAGVVVLRPSVWAEDAAMTDEECAAALAELEARQFVLTDERTRELMVRTFIRNDGVANQPNVLRNALVVAMLIRSPTLRRALAVELRRLPPALPPTKTPRGRLFIYPDPHAAAAELDPDGPPPPGDEEDDQNPSRNPSGNPPDRTLPGTLEGTPRGRGRGSGGGNPLSVDGSEEKRERERATDLTLVPDSGNGPSRQRPTDGNRPLLAVLADAPEVCASCRAIPADRRGKCGRCMGLRKAWERDRAAVEAAQRAERAQIAAARAACTRCDDGWISLPPATPTSQARTARCSCSLPGTSDTG